MPLPTIILIQVLSAKSLINGVFKQGLVSKLKSLH